MTKTLLRIFQDSRNLSSCRSCGAPIEWAETAKGTRMPFNPPIVTVPALLPVILAGRISRPAKTRRIGGGSDD